MSIDRIGKGAPPVPAKPASEISKTETSRGAEEPKPFALHAERTSAPVAVPAATPAAVSPLERLRRGEVDLDGYLDLKVHEATAHLKGLRPAELEGIRSALRDRVAQDPALAEIVRRATGEVPGVKE